MMNREKMNELPTMQIGFIDSICAPIYTAFAKLFPQQLYPLIEGCLENRDLWRKLAESNTRPEIPVVVTNYLACDTDGPTTTTATALAYNETATKLLPANLNISKSETSLPSQILEALNDGRRRRYDSDDDEDQVGKVDFSNSTKRSFHQQRQAKSACSPNLMPIENKLAETGISSSIVVVERHVGQRRSV